MLYLQKHLVATVLIREREIVSLLENNKMSQKIIVFGKHKGGTFEETLRKHPEYCEWIRMNCRKTDCEGTHQFREYIVSKHNIERRRKIIEAIESKEDEIEGLRCLLEKIKVE